MIRHSAGPRDCRRLNSVTKPDRYRHAVERPEDLLQSGIDSRLPADPGSPGRHPEDGHHDTFQPV
ncbi:hypothetical protein T10_1499 [Trichinella papuae]|uniref:Uncharacterized protein n=1 Tax=Trichinella papuae TaxID=268474 RepID=A0A0V1MLZ0_9BILA|nr:hypothetical protein T10_1499 [Trichinella papuae]